MISRHHEGQFGSCFICGKTKERRYDHFCGLSAATQQYIQRHHNSSDKIPGNSCLCRSHSQEAQRNHQNSEHLPTWSKSRERITDTHTVTQTCAYPECTASSSSTKIIVASKATNEAFCQALNVSNTEQCLSLCEAHYEHLYWQIHTYEPCAGCGAKPRARQGAYTHTIAQMHLLYLTT